MAGVLPDPRDRVHHRGDQYAFRGEGVVYTVLRLPNPPDQMAYGERLRRDGYIGEQVFSSPDLMGNNFLAVLVYDSEVQEIGFK